MGGDQLKGKIPGYVYVLGLELTDLEIEKKNFPLLEPQALQLASPNLTL